MRVTRYDSGGRLVCCMGTEDALFGFIELSSGVRCITILGMLLISHPAWTSCAPPSITVNQELKLNMGD